VLSVEVLPVHKAPAAFEAFPPDQRNSAFGGGVAGS